MITASSWLVLASNFLAVATWAFLVLGVAYARLFVAESLPNPVIVFSAKGLDSLLVELASLALGALGLLLAIAASTFRRNRNRWLATAFAGNALACLACLALLA
jgi:hypothetical protein